MGVAQRGPSGPPSGRVWIPPGTFTMGSDMDDYPEEGPPHPVTVDGFWMDATPVTVAAFRRFVEATRYVTVAEREIDPAAYPLLDPAVLMPGSMVFTPAPGPVDLTNFLNWWRFVSGASWRHPAGPSGGFEVRDDHPVTHVAWEDAEAYATWSGEDLPTEAEWERAARGGLEGATYAWGDEFEPGGTAMANTWVGEFPWENRKPPHQQRTTAVGSYRRMGTGCTTSPATCGSGRRTSTGPTTTRPLATSAACLGTPASCPWPTASSRPSQGGSHTPQGGQGRLASSIRPQLLSAVLFGVIAISSVDTLTRVKWDQLNYLVLGVPLMLSLGGLFVAPATMVHYPLLAREIIVNPFFTGPVLVIALHLLVNKVVRPLQKAHAA